MRHAAAALLLVLAACSAPAPAEPLAEGECAPAPGLDAYRFSGPHAIGNLAVYILHDRGAATGDLDCLTLEDGQKYGAVRVREKDDATVNELLIENTGSRPVYLQAGDTVKGGQQDRTIAVDFILPPRSGPRTIEAFCVEPGRWATRGSGLAVLSAPTSGAVFALAEEPTPVASKEQKLAVRLSKSQEGVWEAGKQVNENLAKAKLVASQQGGGAGLSFTLDEPKNSYVEAVEDPAVAKKVEEITSALSRAVDGRRDAVGAAFCVNGRVQNIEIYSASGLFRKLWPKLLRAAAVEALSLRNDGQDLPPPVAADLRGLLLSVAGGKGQIEARKDGPTVRVYSTERAVLFDTEEGGRLLHRQLLTK